MSGRAWLALLVLVAAIGWWYSPVSPRKPVGYERVDAATEAMAQATTTAQSRNASSSAIACQLPSLVQPFDPPRQSLVPSSLLKPPTPAPSAKKKSAGTRT